jgi:hypothetical protein
MRLAFIVFALALFLQTLALRAEESGLLVRTVPAFSGRNESRLESLIRFGRDNGSFLSRPRDSSPSVL